MGTVEGTGEVWPEDLKGFERLRLMEELSLFGGALRVE